MGLDKSKKKSNNSNESDEFLIELDQLITIIFRMFEKIKIPEIIDKVPEFHLEKVVIFRRIYSGNIEKGKWKDSVIELPVKNQNDLKPNSEYAAYFHISNDGKKSVIDMGFFLNNKMELVQSYPVIDEIDLPEDFNIEDTEEINKVIDQIKKINDWLKKILDFILMTILREIIKRGVKKIDFEKFWNLTLRIYLELRGFLS